MERPYAWIGAGVLALFLLAGCGRAAGCTRAGQTQVSAVDGMTLDCVPAGEFLMGSTSDDPLASDDEKPQHPVTLDAFWIDQTEVTNTMFAKCINAGACHERVYSPYLWGVFSHTRDPYFGNPAYDSYPVIMLDWAEAQRYCQWAGRRLPTEAEWEKAARGSDGRIYPWGSGIDCQLANFDVCQKDTSAVDAHPQGASPYGALDMAGNLYEWTADWYDSGYYAHSPTYNPTGSVTGEHHVLRSGSWFSFAVDVRAAARAVGAAEHWYDGKIGFRCALSAAQ